MRKIEDNRDDIITTEEYLLDDADLGIVCYGGTTRSVLAAIDDARRQGLRVGMFRPITIWPFPERQLARHAGRIQRLLVVEHNYGQMVLEVQRVVGGRCDVQHLGRVNGTVITPEEIGATVRRIMACPAV